MGGKVRVHEKLSLEEFHSGNFLRGCFIQTRLVRKGMAFMFYCWSFSSHGQPSVTCWEVSGPDWFLLPSDSNTLSWHLHGRVTCSQWKGNLPRVTWTQCNLSFSLRSSAINTNENAPVNENVLKKYLAYKRYLIYVRCYQFIIIFNKNDASFLLAHLAKKDLFFPPHSPDMFGQKDKI